MGQSKQRFGRRRQSKAVVAEVPPAKKWISSLKLAESGYEVYFSLEKWHVKERVLINLI